MKRFLIFLVIGVVVVVAILIAITSLRTNSSRQALSDYKAKLKERGEILNWADFGYPRTIESNDCVGRLVQAVARIGDRNFEPGLIKLMDLSIPTNIQPCWAREELNLDDKLQPTISWKEFGEEMDSIKANLAEIRSALSNPPSRSLSDPTNLFLSGHFQFVEQRKAAQYLSAETIHALHEQKSALIRENLWALQQLIKLHGDDPTLVNQMIRIAIAGLALHVTWEALQISTWEERGLADLQRAWEQVDLLQSLEKGLVSERLFVNSIVTQFREMSGGSQAQYMNNYLGPGATGKGFDYYWQVYVAIPMWRMNIDADELLTLRHQLDCLDSVRSLNRGKDWLTIERELNGHVNNLEKVTSGPLAGMRYIISTSILPNTRKAVQNAVRNETFRRLAVVAIAIKRYELQERVPPPTLESLVPGFLSAVPIDPMSGKSLCYRVSSDSSFILYSVGEDGVDDGGNAILPSSSRFSEMWDCKDYVWPTVTRPNR